MRKLIQVRDGGQSKVRGKKEWVWRGRLWALSLAVLCVSCSYIWQHIEVGYVQGMCDLLAPLLVILDDGECTLPALGLGMWLPSHDREERITSLSNPIN